MITFSLQSGSNGNAIYVEAGQTRLLIDAGISGKMAERRMGVHAREIRDVHALLISHDHIDHVRSAGVFQRLLHLLRKQMRADSYVLSLLLPACRHKRLHLVEFHSSP
jgi:phosphoribosyl 1,2-cyclic phosphodiesterase